uniref:Senescence domain-containing protein n=1 Tax=Odontella aurita TaxID=265563 RepID=A0A7S4K9V0_9STRA|mmetsp:Transcript_7734/g.22726  ORF Transcript_7734/g.22726 Transcript_7734/m.22726 type:complete len:525 (+) Transcript_7734:333-1907(+)
MPGASTSGHDIATCGWSCSKENGSCSKQEGSNYDRYCREKNWAKVAKLIVPSSPGKTKSERTGMRAMEDILFDMETHCVPTAIVIHAVLLCVQEKHPSHRSPTMLALPRTMPETRSEVDGAKVALQLVGNYLASSSPISSKLLVAKLLLTSHKATETTSIVPQDALTFILGNDIPQISPDTYPVLWGLRGFCSGTSFAESKNDQCCAQAPVEISVYCVNRNSKKRCRPDTSADWGNADIDFDNVSLQIEKSPKQCGIDGIGTNKLEAEKSITILRGEYVAAKIAHGAKWLESGIAGTAVYAARGIDAAGNFIKERTPPREEPAMNRRDRIITGIYTDAAKRVTGGIRETVRTAATGVCRASTLGAKELAQHFHERDLGSKIVPDREEREVLQAVGAVGLATLGAIVVINEALHHTSATVAEKTAALTVDIIQKRHGTDAAKIAKDTCESMGNVLGAYIDVQGLDKTAVSKGVIKSSGKVKIKGEVAMHESLSREMTAEYVKKLHQRISPLEKEETESCNSLPTA